MIKVAFASNPRTKTCLRGHRLDEKATLLPSSGVQQLWNRCEGCESDGRRSFRYRRTATEDPLTQPHPARRILLRSGCIALEMTLSGIWRRDGELLILSLIEVGPAESSQARLGSLFRMETAANGPDKRSRST
jgi:hypothetical protein